MTAGELAARMVASALASGGLRLRPRPNAPPGALGEFAWYNGPPSSFNAHRSRLTIPRLTGGRVDVGALIDALARDIERQRAAVALLDATGPRTSGA